MGKKFTILLTSFLGISTILVYLAIGGFLFQKDLLFPKVQASPATCTVDDDLVINGTVGIGTSSPANIFHIQTDQNWPRIILESTGFPANPTAELNLWAEDAAGITQEMNIYHTAGSGMGIWTSYADFVFVILPNGNVGIGTEDPGTNKLKVAGDAEITGNLNVGGEIYGTIFGDWEPKGGGPHNATTDGLVVVTIIASGPGAHGYTVVRTNAVPPPTTIRGAASVDYDNDVTHNSFAMPVRKNDFWTLTWSIHGATVVNCWWIPLGG